MSKEGQGIGGEGDDATWKVAAGQAKDPQGQRHVVGGTVIPGEGLPGDALNGRLSENNRTGHYGMRAPAFHLFEHAGDLATDGDAVRHTSYMTQRDKEAAGHFTEREMGAIKRRETEIGAFGEGGSVRGEQGTCGEPKDGVRVLQEQGGLSRYARPVHGGNLKRPAYKGAPVEAGSDAKAGRDRPGVT